MLTTQWHEVHENKYITYTLISISLILLVSSTTLHFYHHFKCQSCCPPPPKWTVPRQRSSIIQAAIKLRCLCATSDGENFDFFPMSFPLYLVFVLFICCILILKMFILHLNNDFINNYNFEYPSISNILSFHSIDKYHNDADNLYDLLIMIIDIFLIYSIMIMSLIESLFTFYRFYTTLMTTKHLSLTKITDVLKKFALYTVLFVFLYGVTMNLFFWIFPFVILLHCVFNFYCNWRFASMLIMAYSSFVDMHISSRSMSEEMDDANGNVIKCAYFMRKVSLISTFMQTIYLTLFLCIYYINMNLIIFYLPILWSISSFIFTLNFVRNRNPIKKISNRLKCTSIATVVSSPSIVEMPPTADTMHSILFAENAAIKNTQITQPKRVAFDGKAVPKKQYDLQITAPQKVEAILILKAIDTSNKTPLPNENVEAPDTINENTPLSKSDSNTYKKTPTGCDSPSSFLADFKITNPNDRQVSFGNYVSNTLSKAKPYFGAAQTGQSMEYTQHSAMDISVRTEIDAGGAKQEEYNRYLSNHHSNIGLPAPNFTAFPSLNVAGNVVVIKEDTAQKQDIEEEDVKVRASVHEHKLDTLQLMLQLTLLKRFGFDMRDIKKSFA